MKLGDNAAMQVDAISTGSIGLDLALGVGGVPRGRIIEVLSLIHISQRLPSPEAPSCLIEGGN